MTPSAQDTARLQAALALAATAIGVSDPNPRVGCVIARADGLLIGEGATQRLGGAHAEVMAMRQARAAGHDLRGAQVWVTLEPCAHHGRTPPCCDALIAAGVARVVVAVQDPFPQVAGAGIARLRAAGIRVDMASDIGARGIAQAARELNIGFFSRFMRGRPWVRMKVAASLDGRTALPDGRSQWITGAPARADGHAWRKRAGAVLTGIGTVLADDPRLDVRLVPTTVQPLRVVLDSALRTPATAQVLAPPGRALLLCTQATPQQAAAWATRGAELVCLAASAGRPDLHAVLAELARREVNELHVEAGPTLNGSLLTQGLVDELLVYQAPVLLGAGRAMADVPVPAALAQATRFTLHEVERVGDDLRLLLRPSGVSEFLTFGPPPD